ncbi:hypothetical protein GCM10010112_22310 [Actinoplanes lobatus]|uniref:Uncharacterized protein (DUF1330 family) n=1 Tax=Actinoplanes lobatus TaxID=113568 RepID=A0A7W7HIS0_9ACTN|nr:hypothetical protein [Actinoplanes lobatus]MBB4751274.1 uncharacterized protein (DUF1330 family) [Actinoplanes lobatus]GGN63237.1 hypothetical protein GCM10010112_22310 [Actinoplanes lobatus]GIE44784.1 hypothetical protein Alo02nite_76820 [Actinoplanes lobatus]
MTIQLCVFLWARPGAVEALTAYEDKVLALLSQHDGRLVERARTADGAAPDAPAEVQLIEFRSQAGYDGFLADPRRTAMSAERDAAIARTDLFPVTLT